MRSGRAAARPQGTDLTQSSALPNPVTPLLFSFFNSRPSFLPPHLPCGKLTPYLPCLSISLSPITLPHPLSLHPPSPVLHPPPSLASRIPIDSAPSAVRRLIWSHSIPGLRTVQNPRPAARHQLVPSTALLLQQVCVYLCPAIARPPKGNLAMSPPHRSLPRPASAFFFDTNEQVRNQSVAPIVWKSLAFCGDAC